MSDLLADSGGVGVVAGGLVTDAASRRIQVFAEDGGTFGWRVLEDGAVVFDGGGYEDKAHAEDFARDHYGFDLEVEDLAPGVGRRAES